MTNITPATTGLVAITREPGVEDLPSKVKARFAMAIKAERAGDNERAEEKLAEAITLCN